MVGINGEEEIKAEQLKSGSYEANRMRSVQSRSAGELGRPNMPSRNTALQGQNGANMQRTAPSASRPAPQQRQQPPVVNSERRAPSNRVDTQGAQRSSSVTRTPAQERYNRLVEEERRRSTPTPAKTPAQKKYAPIAEEIKSKRLAEEKARKKEERANKLIKCLTAAIIVISLGLSMYALVIFGNVPFITKWRNIWIETAMTTDQHKWLATSFFPEYLIKDVMGAQVDIKDIGKTDINKEEEEPDILGQKDLVVGEPDSHGNEVLINDIEQGIVVLKVKTSNFVGRLVLIDDPSRVYISATDYKNSRGEFICNYLEKEDAVIGMNASGFYDPGGTSVGGIVTARCISQGEYWGDYSSKYITVGFDKDDRLVVGEFSDWEEHNMRDAFQYHPALIINGDKVIEGSSGWGLQPRSVIGQAANGVVMFFVVDGRQVGYSLGATMGDCADVLEEYGAVNAGACDGGSSSVLAYEGEILNRPSTDMPTGRYLPNAWVVARKTTN